MATIEIEVDDALAKAWKNCDPAVRRVYEEKIIAILKELQAKFSEEINLINKLLSNPKNIPYLCLP